jgi:hypothetical protein
VTRRQALMAVVGVLMARRTTAGTYTGLKHSPAHLIIPLDQWASFSISYRGETVTIPVQEVFDTLKELPE